ncbi:hypothetical protein HDU96_002576 [Phlyctochytrium bullatum]|nr:hypothetical protein HDU96_002576 [Phlyctochytrium bullatum]
MDSLDDGADGGCNVGDGNNVEEATERLSILTVKNHITNSGVPLSPSTPLSPRMVSAIEKEKVLEIKAPPPVRDDSPRVVPKMPASMRRKKVVVQTIVIDDTSLPQIIPKIMSFVEDDATLRSCMFVNKIFMHSAVNELYSSIVLTGSNGPVLKRLIKLMAMSAEGDTIADYRAAVTNLEITDIVLDEQEVTPYQSWNLVRELIRRVSPYLQRLHLDSDDFRFGDQEYFPEGTCGLDQRVVFPRIKALSIGPGCVAFPDSFIIDLLRRCPPESLHSIRFPGCITAMAGTGYFLIAERGGAALRDLILTPPSSYPPRTIGSDEEGGDEEARGWDDARRGDLGPYDPSLTWDTDLLAEGLIMFSTATPQLKALDLSGHTMGIRPGTIEILLRGCEELEELDLPCGVTDATLYEILTVRPEHLWRLNLACSCYKSHTNPITPWNAKTVLPCSFITDGVVRALLDEVMAGKPGALIMLPSHVMEVKTARMIPMLTALEAVPGAKVDMTDTNGIYIPRIGVNVVVPNGRVLT